MARVLHEYEYTADNPVPPVVRVSPDHGRTVLWGDRSCVDPSEVGISDDLAARLWRWYDMWADKFIEDHRDAWPSDADRAAWEAEGEAILAALDAEFGGRIRFVGGFAAD